MRSASIGIRAASRSSRARARPVPTESRRGFSLIEALVALALVLTFAAVLGPYLFQARRIVAQSERRVAAHVLLRSLLDAPFDRGSLDNVARSGEANGLRWRLMSEPIVLDASVERAAWPAYRIVASVSWAPGQIVNAETIRLGRAP
jgi:prepilin-type N-terminal cleavage/methylation domain-containing protein